MVIYKILRASELKILNSNGSTLGSEDDQRDGFIHFCTEIQLIDTCKLHFKGEFDLFLVSVRCNKLGSNLKWEKSRGNQLFPHLFRKLYKSEISSIVPYCRDQIGKQGSE